MGEGDPRPLQGIPSRPENNQRAAQELQGVVEGNMAAQHVEHHEGHERCRHQPRHGHVLFYPPVPGLLQVLGALVRHGISGVLHGGLEYFPGNVPFGDHEGRLCGQVHRREHHAVHLLQGPLHHAGAGGAGHPRDGEARLELLLFRFVHGNLRKMKSPFPRRKGV